MSFAPRLDDRCTRYDKPEQRRVRCVSCEQSFEVEDGPECPFCGHDHSEDP